MKKVAYKKILVTHDGSKLASIALPHALFLAQGLNTQILLLRVVEILGQEMTVIGPMEVTPPIPVFGENVEEMVKEDKKIAQEHLDRLKIELEDAGARMVETKVTQGMPDKEIVITAKEEHCDLIVMSTHGRSGLGRTLLGSVTDSVIRHSPYPVLVVHPSRAK